MISAFPKDSSGEFPPPITQDRHSSTDRTEPVPPLEGTTSGGCLATQIQIVFSPKLVSRSRRGEQFATTESFILSDSHFGEVARQPLRVVRTHQGSDRRARRR